MSNLKIHLSYTLSIVALSCLAYYYFNPGNASASGIPSIEVKKETADNNSSCSFQLTRQGGYNFIKPLLHASPENESEDLGHLKAKILNLVEDEKRLGMLTSASVYLVSLSDGRWLYINPGESFNPGSLIKVPMLMTYLKASESDPSLLSKKIVFDDAMAVPNQTYTSLSIQKGKSYTVKELLNYMIVYSDNNATRLLNEHVVVSDFVKTFTDLNLPKPNVQDRNYHISAKHYSSFMLVLYYATYISKKNSEYAMELLTQCDFKNGFVKNLPAGIKVAHKFGEWGDNRMNIHEMHESGVFYLDDKPYLLTVMINGSNSKDLPEVLSKISRLVYDDFSAGAKADLAKK